MDLGTILRREFKRRKLTQLGVAQETGIPQAALSAFMAGKTELSLGNASKLATFFGLTLVRKSRPKRKAVKRI